jgi:predicted AlkP superfamily phosphohydrolase/phosphomutase
MEQIKKVIIIGLDGATWNLIKPWADKGLLPTFKELMEKGVWGELESTVPPWTIPAWYSLFSGKSPVKLGFFSFMVRKGYNFYPYF